MNPLGTKLAATLGAGLASTVAGIGAWTIAQANANDLPELIGGGVVLTAGLIALRMVLRGAAAERESAEATEKRLKADLNRAEARAQSEEQRRAQRIADLEAELDKERDRAARLLIAFDRERTLRLSLEEAGIVERRTGGVEPLELVRLEDATDLNERLENTISDQTLEELEENPELGPNGS